MTLAWIPRTDPRVVGYNLYFGGVRGIYTNKISVGKATNVTVSGLVPGAIYYFAATTYSPIGLESALSSEVSCRVPMNWPPTLNAIGNLTVNRNAGLQTVILTDITSGATSENQTLAVTAASSNTGLIPHPTVNYTTPNTTGSLTFTPVANRTGKATITVTVNDGGASHNIVTRTFTVTVVNNPPTLNPIGDLSIRENAGLQTMNLSGISSGATNESQKLAVKALSSNTRLIPHPKVNYTSPNTAGSLTFAPVANTFGTATITVTVNDGDASHNIVTRTFTVTVAAVNNPPTLNTIGNRSIRENGGLQTVNLSGISSGAANESQTLAITAVSSDSGLIPDPTVNYTSRNATGRLTFKPVTNASGTATITVTVNDGGASNNIVARTFTVTVTTTGSRPVLTCQLTNEVALVGQTKTFTVKATGSGTLKYQWKLNGTVLSAISSTLTLGYVTTNQSGVYSVTVADQKGSTNSAARLIVYATAAGVLAPAGLANGQYALTVDGVEGCRYIVQASTDFINWIPVQTNTAPFTFVDAEAGRFNQRFYRSVYAP